MDRDRRQRVRVYIKPGPLPCTQLPKRGGKGRGFIDEGKKGLNFFAVRLSCLHFHRGLSSLKLVRPAPPSPVHIFLDLLFSWGKEASSRGFGSRRYVCVLSLGVDHGAPRPRALRAGEGI